MQVILYRDYHDIDVLFDDGTIFEHAQYSNFKTGLIKNPNMPVCYNVGYTGARSCPNKKARAYWSHMLERCYSEKFQAKRPRYTKCTVCESWLNLQIFASWFDDNYYEVTGEIMHLDKDMMCKNNTVYCPSCCVFVPAKINSLFVKNNINRGRYPIGVSKDGNKFIALCGNGNNEQEYIGTFPTQEEAFLAYKTRKEDVIKSVADSYKNKIPKRLYDAMYRYKVDIDD